MSTEQPHQTPSVNARNGHPLIYVQGWEAQEAGIEEEENPFAQGTQKHDDWKRGYIDADIFYHPEFYDHGD